MRFKRSAVLFCALLGLGGQGAFGASQSASGVLLQKADEVLIEKSKRTLSLLKEGQVFKTYKVSLGREPVGPKTEQGDGKTPEGDYVIAARNPHSQFHLSLKISYPNAADRKQARTRGVDPGDFIMIHGLPNGLSEFGKTHVLMDWTDGCIAVTDSQIEEIWKIVKVGTKVRILP